jgi:hypothetical protein
MGRLALVVVMLLVSGVIYLIKAGIGQVTGNDNVNFKDESRKVMEKTAKGINWMNQQWENAKSNSGGQSALQSANSISDLSATEIIARVKADPVNFDMATAEGTYIEQAAIKMNKRQFDDARKLVMQLQAGEARDFMLREIEEKRN